MKSAYPAFITLACICAAPALADARHSFNIPAQRLDTALIALGGQAHISIGGVDARLAVTQSRAVRGTMPVARALQIMLRGTGFDFAPVDAQSIRIIRAVPKPAKPVPPPKPTTPKPSKLRPAPPPEPVAQVQDIIVTASKQQQSLDSYPGSAHVERVGGTGMSEQLGTGAFVARIPALTTTNLGPGRNKIFVRGIADSSFSGPTQSTVGLYLGDLRLTYNAPEPDLRLYDIDRIEVIEGPQGTLYGAGALGGIIRIMPKAPQIDAFHASASAGVSATKGAASGSDVGGVVNIPLIRDDASLRIIGYRQIEGGYINNLDGKMNLNRTRIAGGRATLRIRPGSDWTIDLGAVAQNIDTSGSQYAEIGLPPRAHAANIDQPHDNDFKATNLVIMKKWDRLSLLSSTGIVQHDLSERFDATGYLGQPDVLVYDASNKISLMTHETRLSYDGNGQNTWVAGISLLRSIDRIERKLGPVGAPQSLASLRDEKQEMALFGEATQTIGQNWSATMGARLARALSLGELIGGTGPEFEPRRTQLRFLPTAALSWKPHPDLLAYLRYQSGFRSGGIAISSGQINTATRFESDEIKTVELGLRLGGAAEGRSGRISGGIAASYSRWNSIQADLISTDGLPYTANIGNGAIYGLEANARWRPTDRFSLDAALFVNNSALNSPAMGFEESAERPLPNVAKTGGRFSAVWEGRISSQLTFKLDGTLRYVGQSSLGTTAPLILEQGEYVQADMAAALDAGAWQITLDASNLLNKSGNSFSYGNPFSVGQGKQITPLRPRTIRIGLHFGF
jgi:iron complex outermembrane recepter protein